MTFIIISILLTLFACVVLIIPFLKNHQVKVDTNSTNLSIYKAQIAELKQDLTNGNLSSDQHQSALNELKNTLGYGLNENPVIAKNNKSLFGVLITIVMVLGISIITYTYLGNYQQITAINKSADQPTPSVPELIAKLETELKTNPENAKGWWILGQVYQELQEFDKAVNAYRNAYKYKPDSPEILTQLGYIIAIINNGNFTDESLSLFQRAIKLAPNNQDANYLIGRYYFQKGQYQSALNWWQGLLPNLSPEDVALVRNDIKTAQEKLGIVIKTTTPNNIDKTTTDKQLAVYVALSKNLKANLDDVVFVSVHAQTGAKIPLAVTKLTVADLPKTIILDSSMAIIPNMNLNTFKQLKIKARVSKSGTAIAKSGDYFGETLVDDSKKPLKILIDKIK